MAYRYEKNENGESDLVIDGFENGIADSPFKGIGNMRNLGIRYYEGVAYVNYKRQAATIQNANGVSSQTFTVTIASPAVFTSVAHGLSSGDSIIFSTTGALPTGLTVGTVYFVISAGLTADNFEISATRGGSAINTTGTQSGTHTFTVTITNPKWYAKSKPGLIYISDDNRHIWKQTAVDSSIFKHLSGNNVSVDIGGLAWWNNYLFTFGEDSNARIEICGTGTGDSTITSSNWNNTQITNNFTVTIASPAVFTLNGHGLKVGSTVVFSTSGALPTGLTAGTVYYVIASGLTVNNFEVSTTLNGSAVNTSGSQSGTHTITYLTGLWPIINDVTITFSTQPKGGDTDATGFTYTDASGSSRSFWNGPTGFYNLNFINANTNLNQIVLASFTQGSNTVTWTPALNGTPSDATATLFFNSNSPTATNVQHMTIVSDNTGDLYYCNGPYIGALTLNPNQIFNKSDMNTFTFYSNILALPPTETSTWFTELRDQLIIAGIRTIYPWNFFSPFWGVPIPLDEDIQKTINILNTIYIFAGNKGNIYQSNGYSIERFKKLPDNIAGVIDPAWYWGGVMSHRQYPYFQARAVNAQTGANIMSGIFSLNISTGALTMENENSAGASPAGQNNNGLLIDDSTTAINYDKYYSAFGATNSKIDFNDTTLYSNNEPFVETDIIPVGTFLQNKTFGSIEFKLDQPMQSGDSITVYGRPSLSDAYTLLGTTTTTVLADCFQSFPLENMQWAQFKVTFSCNSNSTASSFVPLREIRLR